MPRPSFSAIYQAEFSFVGNLVRRLGVPRHQVDDVAQEVFAVVHRRFDEFQFDGSIRGWLYAIAVGVCRNCRRTRRRRSRLFHESAIDLDKLADEMSRAPDEQAARQEAGRRLIEALDRLTPPQRDVLLLSDVEQLTAREVASLLAIPANTVSSRLRVARGKLRYRLAQSRRE